MKQFLPILAVAMILVAMPLVSAIELEYYGIEDTIKNDFTVENKITLRFSKPINHLDYNLDFDVHNLSVSSTFQSTCNVIERDPGSTISCDFVGMGDDKQLVLYFLTRNAIREVSGNYQFSVNYGVSLPIGRTFTLIRLPEKNFLAADIANMSFEPKDGRTITDGKHIMVYWENTNLTSGSNLQFSVLYSKPSEISESLLIGVALIFIVLIAVLVFFMKRSPPRERPATSLLNKDEKAIVDILQKNDGKALQKVLVRDTDFSKAKVSRLVKSLRERGVVDIEPVSGRENRIILKLGKQ